MSLDRERDLLYRMSLGFRKIYCLYEQNSVTGGKVKSRFMLPMCLLSKGGGRSLMDAKRARDVKNSWYEKSRHTDMA